MENIKNDVTIYKKTENVIILKSMNSIKGKIFEKIPKIMEEIKAIDKNKRNQQQGFSYRGIDDFYNAANPVLSKYGVFMIPRIINSITKEKKSSRGTPLYHRILTIEYTVPGYEGKTLNLTSHPDGVMVGPALTSSEFVETKADKVIAIEKGGLFTRFVEEKVHDKFNALLVLTAGQAPRATRHFIRRLNRELSLPVYIFTDGDPWGMHIAMVIISGSINAAHMRELTTPDAKWSGVWATDIVNYKLPTDPLEAVDIKRLHELRNDPRYKDSLWQREIKKFLKIRKKAEQEAFSRYGLTYIVDEYLPAKLEQTA